ncbi:hypothetical protein RHSIM_Rhsim10G0073200 [Rhododendron simsii]|uniref:Uncharacterized protein n=1 Tax=Rhododendron simsii TaxID=118357 RepID=A0A834GAX1_RHOSS|nr:hypothetical protein RHSIM_Rhsim10G0073200 [Rhododendron simsii]
MPGTSSNRWERQDRLSKVKRTVDSSLIREGPVDFKFEQRMPVPGNCRKGSLEDWRSNPVSGETCRCWATGVAKLRVVANVVVIGITGKFVMDKASGLSCNIGSYDLSRLEMMIFFHHLIMAAQIEFQTQPTLLEAFSLILPKRQVSLSH